MPSTRSNNPSANNRIYSRDRVPQQVYFPHKRKTVRRPEQNAPEKKQLRFVPEMMRRQEIVQDSEEEDLESEEEDASDGGVAIKEPPAKIAKVEKKPTSRRVKKRSRDVAQDLDDDEPVRPALKCMREPIASKKRKLVASIKHEAEDEEPVAPLKTEQVEDTKRTRRRQSTMTQIVDGRRPVPGSISPQFRRVKKSRTSWSLKGKNDGDEKSDRQRTLTQMVPGLVPLGIVSDEDFEEDLGDSASEDTKGKEFNDAFARRLVEEGLLYPDRGDGVAEDAIEQDASVSRAQSRRKGGLRQKSRGQVALATKEQAKPHASVALNDDPERKDEPHAAQHAGLTPMKKARGSLRDSYYLDGRPTPVVHTKSSTNRTSKPRFGLLSTPEKCKVLEIPSSQSPGSSPISPQMSRHRRARSPLRPRSGNFLEETDTPSRRRKQVTFKEPDKNQVPQAPPLRKFASVIQDSEDEDEVVSDDEGIGLGAHTVRPEAQSLTRGIDNALIGIDIGPETQAILHSIDQACANPEGDDARVKCDASEELGHCINRNLEDSQELGERRLGRGTLNEPKGAELELTRGRPAVVEIKREPMGLIPDFSDYKPSSHQALAMEPGETMNTEDASMGPPDTLPSSTYRREQQQQQQKPEPVTPIEVVGDSDEDDEGSAYSSPETPKVHTIFKVEETAVQVPRSPSPQEETQRSFSSKAEQQLHFEYHTYSQYRHRPPTSSMYVAPDAGFSYQATPFPPYTSTQQVQHSGHLSQATTVDPSQPSPRSTTRRTRSQPTRSATTTPSKIPSSMPFVSPVKPPPLLIPSSYPSPGKVMAGWSSSVVGGSSPVARRATNGKGESQWGGEASWEDFSIPAPPPPLDISDDEED